MERYQKLDVAGEGTFGVVYKAKDRVTDEIVAIKRIRRGHAREGVHFTALREIKLLQELHHENIVALRDVFVHKGSIHLVLDYIASDLDALLKDRSVHLAPEDIKGFMQQMLKGVAKCHACSILHRDIKPDNMLIAPGSHVKLADFGLARICASPERRYSHQVVTNFYRPPELFFGARTYGPAVDIWSMGCVFAEMFLRVPLFAGATDIELLSKIFAVTGTPNDDNWPDVALLPSYIQFEETPPIPWSSVLSAASPDAIDLLSRMMQLDPARRCTAAEALAHPYFTNSPAPTPPMELPIPSGLTQPTQGKLGFDSDEYSDSDADSDAGEAEIPPRGTKRPGGDNPDADAFETPSKRMRALVLGSDDDDDDGNADTGAGAGIKKALFF